jgi:hypothetical protein
MANPLSIHQVNYLNAGLMILSAALAVIFPFELFLLAYAILGPLHYLTEISWLHDKGYYTQGKRDSWFLIAACVAVSLFYFGVIAPAPKGASEFFGYLAFVAALLFVLFKSPAARLGVLLLAGFAAFFFASSSYFVVLFGILLPTLIHVFVFTGLFLLAGALKGRSLSGLVSLFVFAGIAVWFLFFQPSCAGYQVSDYVKNSYGYFQEDGKVKGFISLNYFVAKFFHLNGMAQPTGALSDFVRTLNDFLYHNPKALSIMSFIAFAYTYHYFNWFSKTSIIRWHEVPRSRILAVVLIWAASLALYAKSYALGLQWLFFLSLVHVFLEFPLNHLTFINIGKELRKMIFPVRAS